MNESPPSSSTIYAPAGSYTLDKAERVLQIRLGIQGPPGSGKTFNALTFPNPLVLNFDRGLIVHEGRKDVTEVPFWNPKYVDSIKKRDGLQAPPNRRDALIDFLLKEAPKLSVNQTMIIDSNRQVEIGFHVQYKQEEQPSSSGKYNKFTEWTEKIKFFSALGTQYKELLCNVIYICHEVPQRDDDGKMIGIRPALSGQSGDTLASDFTDWFRAITVAKPSSDMEASNIKTKYFCSEIELKEWIASTPSNVKTVYLWQTQSDSYFAAKTSLLGQPKFVLANYSVFGKYKRKINTTNE